MNQFVSRILVCMIAGLSSMAQAQSKTNGMEPEAGKEQGIVAQSLEGALKAVGERTGLQIVYVTELVEGKHSQGAPAGLATTETLQKVLEGTGLTYKFLTEHAVAIQGKGEKRAAAQWADFRLGQLNLSEPSSASGAVAVTAEENKDTSGDALDGGAGNMKLEEIVVTAQRRKESLQDVPISISVLSGEQLDSSTATGLADALRSVPGLDSAHDQYTAGTMTYTVRGVSNSTSRAGGAGPIAFYLDGVPYGFIRSAYYPDPSVYDLAQVEFLSGPQGTLYGAGSLNGVLRVLTHNADADEFEFKARGSISSVEDGGTSYGTDVAVNAPLIKGVLGARATVGLRNDSGWIDAVAPPASTVVPPSTVVARDVNDDKARNYRLKLHGQLSDTFTMDLSAWRSEDTIGAPNISRDDRTISSLQEQPGHQQFDAYGLELTKQFGSFSLTSVTSYVSFDNDSIVDGNPAGPNALLRGAWTSKVFAQEVNLVSNLAGPWRWSAGAFYRDAKETVWQFLDRIPVDQADTYQNDYEDASRSYAVYGEIGRHLTDTLELSAGLRYFHDDGTTRLKKRYPNTGISAGGIALQPGDEFEATSTATTPRAVLTWTPSSAQTFYASYAQGFRSGFAQQPNVQVLYPNFTPVKPDKLTNYELGNKGSMLGGLFSYQAALFYIDWKDTQQGVTVQIPVAGGNLNTTAQVNSKSVSGMGASLAFTIRPIQDLELGVNGGWNDLAFDEDVLPSNSTTPLFKKGERPLFSPEYTAGASAQYKWALGGGGYRAGIGLSADYKSSTNDTVFNGVSQTGLSDSILIANARLLIEAPANWTASFFVDNLADKNSTPARSLTIPEWSVRMRPRTVGLQLEYRYGR